MGPGGPFACWWDLAFCYCPPCTCAPRMASQLALSAFRQDVRTAFSRQRCRADSILLPEMSRGQHSLARDDAGAAFSLSEMSRGQHSLGPRYGASSTLFATKGGPGITRIHTSEGSVRVLEGFCPRVQ